MKKLTNLKGTKVLSKKQQKSINGGGNNCGPGRYSSLSDCQDECRSGRCFSSDGICWFCYIIEE